MIPLLLQKVANKNHRIFLNGAWNVNVIGIRSTDDPNRFDDTLALVYRDDDLSWVTREFACTTDPGTYWLENGEKATAILCPGQYSSYRLDKHGGRYLALCQRLGPVRVYRDGDKNALLDMHPDSTQEGYFGINIHRASATHLSTEVNKWSAGCQVMADPAAFDDFIASS